MACATGHDGGGGRRRRDPPRAGQARHLPPSAARTGAAGRALPVAAFGVELDQEEGTALGFVLLPDGLRYTAQRLEALEEAAVGRLGPSHVARASPARRPQGVQAPVVTGAGESVRCDPVLGLAFPGESRPGGEVAGPTSGYLRERLARTLGRGPAQRFSRLGRWLGKDGLGRGPAQLKVRHTPHSVTSGLTAACVFDDIIEGTVASHGVLDEGDIVAFLDSRPVFDGHTLVVPRRHFATLAELPVGLLAPLMAAGRRVAAAQQAALGAQGAFFALNEVVSQSVPHVHLHVVPRRRGDGLRGFLWPRHRYRDAEEAEAVAAALRSALPSPGELTP